MKKNGFTLIELVIVMVILGVLAVVAMPRFVDLSTMSQSSATQAALGAIRSTLHLQYANRAANPSIGPSFPSTLTSAEFNNNQLPENKLNNLTGIGVLTSAPSGTATHASNGFWYIVASGEAGAYSDGTIDTSTW